MKKLLVVLALVVMVVLSGCEEEKVENSGLDEDQVYTKEQVDELLSDNTLVEYKYNRYFDMFQIRVHEDETKENWVSIEVYQVDGVGVIKLIRQMENSDTVKEFYELDMFYPLEADYYSLTLYLYDQLQETTYDRLLYGLE